MKKLLTVLITIMVMTGLSIVTTERAEAYEETCFVNADGDEVCIRVTGKHVCTVINGDDSGCESASSGSTGPRPGQSVPCDFHEANCPILDLPHDVVWPDGYFGYRNR